MTMEVLGDRWSLVVIRDLMFGRHRHFRELLNASQEGIASNILASRLAKLTAAGMLNRQPDPSHRQKVTYHLTEASIQLVPVLAQIGSWGARWMPTTTELRVRAEILAQEGPPLWDAFMDELRAEHLEGQPIATNGVRARLEAAYEEHRSRIA
jgi:DNA-binding HxlR family transcriptional regulator